MKTPKFLLLLVASLFIGFTSVAQNHLIHEEAPIIQGDTIAVHSTVMKREIKNTVIVPAQYHDNDLQEEQYPVVYLLNGYGGNYSSWSQIKPNIDDLASEMGVIIVCPDGQNSWYWDSPIDKNMQFETYITKELVQHIDNNYRTIPDAQMRAITGLSMGGHGALWLAIRHSDIFGIAGCMSGGVNIVPFPGKWSIEKRIGKFEENPQTWEAHSVMSLLPTLKQGQLKLIIDCGSADFFFKVNNQLHETLLANGIDHDYITRPGGHNYPYWNNSIDYQFLFFQKAFEAAFPKQLD